MGPQISKKCIVRKSQICKLPHLLKVRKSKIKIKSTNLQICDLRNLFSGRPPLSLVLPPPSWESIPRQNWFCRINAWTGSFSGFCLSLGYRIPCGLFTPGSFYPVVFANGLVLKNLAKWRDLHYSQIFSQTVTFRGFYI